MAHIRPSEYRSIKFDMFLDFVVDGRTVMFRTHRTVDFPVHKMAEKHFSLWRTSARKIMVENLDEWLDEVFANIVAEV